MSAMRPPSPARATLAFEPLEERLAPAIFLVTTSNDAGAGSLRVAIAGANALPGPDIIRFNISGGGIHTIDLVSPLPTITAPLKLAGRTQPGFVGSPLIELNGIAAGPDSDGLTFLPTASDSIVRALAINRFQGDGIRITADNCRVQGCRVGTDPSGSMDLGNGTGIRIENGASGNVIGGASTANGNVLSGNSTSGVVVAGEGTAGNRLTGNFIGTDSTGRMDLGNSTFGVQIIEGAQGTVVGGIGPAARNVISGNNDDGVLVAAAANTIIRGNYIGADRTGTADLGNSGKGIMVRDQSVHTVIGGVGAGNVISGNGETGVWLQDYGTTGNLIQGNRIGVAATSAAPLGNGHYGVFIGLGACNNAIGGDAAGAGNVIAHSGMNGVVLGAGTGNAILRNRIFANAFLGIDLDADGVTANDFNDIDFGANARLNFPVLNAARLTLIGLRIEGSINTEVDQTLRIEFFAAATLESTGQCEGTRYLGSAMVRTLGSNTVDFQVLVPSTVVPAGHFITATATDRYGNTSEFSLGVPVS
jgi:hypothetical protein